MAILRLFIIFAVLVAGLPFALRAEGYDSAFAAAVDSGRPRLALYALSFHNLPRDAAAIDALKSRYGLGPRPARDRGAGLSPLLYSDANINGGTPGSVVVLGGLPFVIDPASRAVPGMVAGGRISAYARASPARGVVFDLGASAFAARALQRDDLGRRHDVAGHQATACAGAYLGRAQWLDICASAAQTRRSMAQSDLHSYALAYARQFPTYSGFAEARGAIKAQVTGGKTRPSLELGFAHASAALGTLSARAEWFEAVEGQHGPRFAADLAVTRQIAGKTTTLFAAFAREGGAQLFGVDREDTLRTIGLSRPLPWGGALILRWDDRRSTLPNYTQQSLAVEVQITGLTF